MLEVLPEPRLREIHVGIFQGMTGTEIDARYPEERTAYRADPFNYINPGGESRQQLQERAYAAWQDITAAELGPEVAIVAHGGTIKMLLLRLFESDAPGLSNVRFGNASITTVTRSGDGWRLTGLAATPHLDSAAL
jgi:broad specificity phosphatase PhoE